MDSIEPHMERIEQLFEEFCQTDFEYRGEAGSPVAFGGAFDQNHRPTRIAIHLGDTSDPAIQRYQNGFGVVWFSKRSSGRWFPVKARDNPNSEALWFIDESGTRWQDFIPTNPFRLTDSTQSSPEREKQSSNEARDEGI
ncbi:MAG: hypothetical protein K2Y21_12455 [Phycisphaerales bacterium]|nr:hypothetical protein [Phycisphaerales bacterium]